MAGVSNPKIQRIIPMLVAVLAILCTAAMGKTIYVGDGGQADFDNIQAGIDAADDGDTVLVAPGEYVITEPITFRGKAITVKSEARRDETTIRMGTPADMNRACVVIFENSETDASILEGFTITGGRGLFNPSVNATGGGGIVFFNASSGTVKNCAIVQNSADTGGGVICAGNALATVNNCTIRDNSATRSGGGVGCWDNSLATLTGCTLVENSVVVTGGGVYCGQNSSVTLADCIVSDNSATGVILHEAGYGGGLYAGDGSMMTLTNCSIANNSAGVGGGGMFFYRSPSTIAGCMISGNSAGWWAGGVACEKELLSMTNCVIARNTAGEGGGGLACGSGGVLTVSNCTIRANSAGNMWGGGGVLCWQGSTTVTNSIIWANISPKGPEISVDEPISTLIIAHSDVAGGQAEVNVEPGCILDWGQGNINTDPCFADPDNDDFHLKSEAGRWDSNSQLWIQDDVTSPCIDAGDPMSPIGWELFPNGSFVNMGAYGGTAEASKSLTEAITIYIQWLGHASVKVWTEDCVVYVDPEGLTESLHDATLVCVTHTHGDHYSPSDIARVSYPETLFVGPPDVVQQYGSGQTIAPGQTIEFDNVNIIAVPAYNTNKPNHPKSRNWVGFIIEIGSQRIYVAGDTDLIEEMKSLGDIDVAILPAGGTYTMNAVEAAEATQYIQPKLAIPYHWGQFVGTLSDAQTFAELADCAVKILTVGETISSDDWPEYSPLIAHWKLDETEGHIAYDSAGNNHGTLNGDPQWVSGFIDGALEFDGDGDYVEALRVVQDDFTLMAWIKTDTPGISLGAQGYQGSGLIWSDVGGVANDFILAVLGTKLSFFCGNPDLSVNSDKDVVTGEWVHVSATRSAQEGKISIYINGEHENTIDHANNGPLDALDTIAVGGNVLDSRYYTGLIDDVRIYDVALTAEEIEALTQ